MKSLPSYPGATKNTDCLEDRTTRTVSPETSAARRLNRAACGVMLFLLTVYAACSSGSVQSTSGDPSKSKTFNFTAYANETAQKNALYYFNSRANISLRPTGGRIVWEDFRIRQKHVATYSAANCRYLLHADAGGSTGNPSTRVSFPLLRSNSATQCHYYIEIFDSYYIRGYEQRMSIFDSQQGCVDDLYIWLPSRGTSNKDIFDVTRVNASREGNPYYLITRVVFKKDYIVYAGGKDKKLLKIHRGSYITFQNRSFFKAYRGVFVK
jgi:hypothetical protein